MKKKCEKCKADEHLDRMGNPIWHDSTAFKCESYFFHGEKLIQSDLCRSRCQVARLKKQVEKLKIEAKYWREHHDFLQDTVTTLRNPNF